MPISDDPMHIDNVRARRAADGAEQDMFRDIAREIDGPPPPGIGTLLKRALTNNRPKPSCPTCDSSTRTGMNAGRNAVDRGDGPEWCDDEWHDEAKQSGGEPS